MNITCITECYLCEQQIETINIYQVICYNCEKYWYEEKDIKTAFDDVIDDYQPWKNHEGYIGFKNEELKDSYMKGIKEGYRQSFFHLCDYFGIIDFYEEKLESYFAKENKEATNGEGTTPISETSDTGNLASTD